jgi:hypothetical protein
MTKRSLKDLTFAYLIGSALLTIGSTPLMATEYHIPCPNFQDVKPAGRLTFAGDVAYAPDMAYAFNI